MAQKIPGNQQSYYQYGDDVVYNLGKNIAGNVVTWSYYPAGNLGVAIGAGLDPAEFEFLPNGPGSTETALGTKTSQDNEPLDIASMNSAWEKQQQAATQILVRQNLLKQITKTQVQKLLLTLLDV
jgi:hypothetical protein